MKAMYAMKIKVIQNMDPLANIVKNFLEINKHVNNKKREKKTCTMCGILQSVQP